MKLLRYYRILLRPCVLLVAFLFMSFTTDKLNVVAHAKGQTIMIALLLDTSNSHVKRKPLDYGDFNIHSKGELTVSKGAAITGQTTQIPLYVYLSCR